MRSAATDRVAEYVRQFERLRDTGGVVHNVHTDPETEGASLLLDDLRYVLREATRGTTHDGPVDPWERHAQRD